MKTGIYRVHVNELTYEDIEVTVNGLAVTISGPNWCGHGLCIEGRYVGKFVATQGNTAGDGQHVCQPRDDGSLDVRAYFEHGPQMSVELTWKPLP